MREIKFRAWNKGINRMFSAEEMGEDELTINPDGRGFVNVNSTSAKLSQYYQHMIPLQYTGLKDVGGKDIYEGDIVIKPANKQRPLEVVFADDICCFEAVHPVGARALSGYVNTAGGVLIIGNIYENKELLDVI